MSYKKKKILAVIPAKAFSSELKNKNLLKIRSKTLVEIATHCCKGSKLIDHILISSDSNKIIELCINAGANSFIKRPKKLSQIKSEILSAWQHSILTLKEEKNLSFDYSILVEPTCPLRRSSSLDNSIKKTINNKLDYLITVSKVEKKFHPQKQFNIKKNDLTPYIKNNDNIINRQELNYTYSKNGVAYVASIDKLFKTYTLNFNKLGYYKINYPTINIDNKEDFKLAKYYYQK